MDPLALFGEDIAPLILQHLSVRDILRHSLVSQFWYDTISRFVSSKIWLRFYEPLGDIECLLRSKRRYTNVKIQRKLPDSLVPIFEKFTWKHVMLRDFTEISYDELKAFLERLAPTLETLDLWDIGAESPPEKDLAAIDFPRLRKLEMNLTTRAVFSFFLGRMPMLRDVTFRDEGAHFANAEAEIMEPSNLVLEFLMRTRIERLKLLECEWTFENDLTQGISSNFKQLTLTVTPSGCTTKMHANICKFIRARPTTRVSASREEYLRKKHIVLHY